MLLDTFTGLPQSINPNNPCIPLFLNTKYSSNSRCFSTRPSSSGKTQWDSNAETVGSERFQFDSNFNFPDDDDYMFGPRRDGKRQSWWSDDAYDGDNDKEDDFGMWEEPSVIDWIFKVTRAFGWMIPAILMSTLLDTGPNTLIMAVALPLGQTALSLLMDRLLAGPSYDPVPRRRTKKRRPMRTASRTKSSGQAQERSYKSRQERRGYQSWASENKKVDQQTGINFGGWDELDKQAGNVDGVYRKEQRGTADGPRGVRINSKLSRRRKKEEPLMLRLMIAVFPILGSWTRFFM